MDAWHCIWDTVCLWFDGNCYNVSEFRSPNPKYVKACLVVGVNKVRLWRKRRVWSLWVCQDLWQPSQTTRQSLRILSETVGWTLRLTENTARDTWGGIFPQKSPNLFWKSCIKWEAWLHILCCSGFRQFAKMPQMLWFNLSLPSFHLLQEAVMIQTIVLTVFTLQTNIKLVQISS